MFTWIWSGFIEASNFPSSSVNKIPAHDHKSSSEGNGVNVIQKLYRKLAMKMEWR